MNPSSLARVLFAVLTPAVLESALRLAKFADRASEDPGDLVASLVDAVRSRDVIEVAAQARRIELDTLQLAADAEVLKLALTTLVAVQVGDSITDEPPPTDRPKREDES